MKVHRFIQESEVPARPDEVFAWHELPGAVERLTPPWEKVEMIERAASLEVGTRVIFQIVMGPLRKRWIAEHVEYDPPHLFTDVQREGPFAYWRHQHRFIGTDRGTTLMRDEVEYALPLGLLGDIFGGAFTRAKLRRMFEYRHQVVLNHFSQKR